jgi:hypothetical protein
VRSDHIHGGEGSSLSIQTATDLILDVVRAADPATAQKAEAMLEAASVRKSERRRAPLPSSGNCLPPPAYRLCHASVQHPLRTMPPA